MSSIGARPRVFVQEVATRDGFQNEMRFVPTTDKVALINALSRTGLAKIEVTSFTSQRRFHHSPTPKR
jgi:hydroxymethylglutaryl-CoA lyase